VIGIAFVLLSSVLLFAQADVIAPDWVLVSHPLHWESPPAKLKLPIHTAPATVMVLYPDGRFASVSCYLVEHKDGNVTMSRGDGFVIRKGRWNEDNGHVITTATVVFRTVQRTSHSVETAERVKYAVRNLKGQRRLNSPNMDSYYERLPRFSDLNELANLVDSRN